MAALAGFISKVGLASGPLIGSLFIMDYGFDTIINIATIALVLATFILVFTSMNKKVEKT